MVVPQMARKKFPCGLLTAEDRQQFTAADMEALNSSLEAFCASAGKLAPLANSGVLWYPGTTFS